MLGWPCDERRADGRLSRAHARWSRSSIRASGTRQLHLCAVCRHTSQPHFPILQRYLRLAPTVKLMVFTRAQTKRKAVGDSIYIAPPARRRRRAQRRTSIEDYSDELLLMIVAISILQICDDDNAQLSATFMRTTLEVPKLALFTREFRWYADEHRVNIVDIWKATDFIPGLKAPSAHQ
jgi:hypothetical protein